MEDSWLWYKGAYNRNVVFMTSRRVGTEGDIVDLKMCDILRERVHDTVDSNPRVSGSDVIVS